MARFVIIVAAFLLVGVALACAGGSSDPPQPDTLSTPISSPAPTLTPIPTPRIDFTKQCGPPLSERHCSTVYRPPPPSCPISQVWELPIAGLVGIGRPPVWKAGSPVSGGFKNPPLTPVAAKTIWVVDNAVEGPVKLTGRRLDGPGVVVFPWYELDEGFYETGGLGNPENFKWQRTELVLVLPHTFEHRTGISIPSAGCWQFTAQVGTETVEFVLYLYEAPS